jgi:hypothetical protein
MCAVAAALRLGAWLPNVTAVGALAIYSGSRLKPWLAWIPALAVMAVTDLLLQRWFGYPPFNRVVYTCFLIDAVLGAILLRRVTVVRVGLGAFVSALQFFLITNFHVWLKSSDSAPLDYPKTLGGLMTCYAMALPFFGYTFLYEAESLEAAESLLKADPFHTAGVFHHWTLRPWTVANANRSLFPE